MSVCECLYVFAFDKCTVLTYTQVLKSDFRVFIDAIDGYFRTHAYICTCLYICTHIVPEMDDSWVFT